jgi:Spy/CpxP family protein refolding chaperone
MRTFCKWALVLAAGTVWAAPARAGGQDDVPGKTTFQLLLLRQKSVQQELKITPEQAKKIQEFCNKEHEAFLKAVKLGKEEAEKKILELRAANQKFLEDNLSEAQRKRLGQIYLQVTALHQLVQPEAAKALNLTDAQQTKFKEMHAEARKKFFAILEAKENREARHQKLKQMREEVYKAIGEVLTAEQKAKAKELVGEEFKGELQFDDPEAPSPKATSGRLAAPSVGAVYAVLRRPRVACGLNTLADTVFRLRPPDHPPR